MKQHLITFDLDGTLVHTAPEIAVAVNRTLEAFGLEPVELGTVVGYIGHGTRALMRQVLALRGIEPDTVLDKVMPVFDEHYDACTGTLAKPYPGVPDALVRLQVAGIKLGVVTNKEHRFALRTLEETGLIQFFDVVLGGDSLAYKKPHPLPIHYCLEHLKVPVHAAAHLGDSKTDVETARRAGVLAWVVPYGYNYGEPIEDTNPDRIFQTVEQMVDHVVSVHCND